MKCLGVEGEPRFELFLELKICAHRINPASSVITIPNDSLKNML